VSALIASSLRGAALFAPPLGFVSAERLLFVSYLRVLCAVLGIGRAVCMLYQQRCETMKPVKPGTC